MCLFLSVNCTLPGCYLRVVVFPFVRFVFIFVNDIAKKDTVASAHAPRRLQTVLLAAYRFHLLCLIAFLFALFQQMEYCFLQLTAENRFFVTHLFRVVVFRVVVFRAVVSIQTTSNHIRCIFATELLSGLRRQFISV